MLAVDTNVVVRYLVNDDAKQSPRARKLIESRPILLLKTVAFETEWVLRSAYRLDRQRIADALRAFAGLPNITVEDEAVVALAIDWFAQGLDFADALHAASASIAQGFASFDEKLLSHLRKLGTTELVPV